MNFNWQISNHIQGETIETFFGAAFCLSTMAGKYFYKNQYLIDYLFIIAAGLGNAVSDVMGIG